MNYSVLSEPGRHTSFGRGQNSDRSLVSGWYRFQSGSYAKMLDQCVSLRKCLTVVTGFLNGLLPLIEDGIVDREACFHGHSNCCHRKVKIHVRRCDGFYVYYLNPSPAGLFRYCAIQLRRPIATEQQLVSGITVFMFDATSISIAEP